MPPALTRLTPFAVILSLIGVSACDMLPARHESPTNLSGAASCRQRADDIFLKQNRAYLTQRDTRDSPFSSTGLAGVTSAGLGSRYGRDEMVDDCIAASQSGRSAADTIPVTDVSPGVAGAGTAP